MSWGKCRVKINEISRGDIESNNLELLLAEAPRPHAPAAWVRNIKKYICGCGGASKGEK
jgi:hypothetical protein